MVKRGDVLVDSGAGFGWRNSTGRGGYFKDVDASELGDLTTGVAVFADGEGDGLRLCGRDQPKCSRKRLWKSNRLRQFLTWVGFMGIGGIGQWEYGFECTHRCASASRAGRKPAPRGL